ncbi:hypothetical protein [Burkholderia lata]|uniref:hypothetical protein n=1 Tax=Burkholderia lata (strain ATCC 17760 / DSM 23089 / LMG 22485 / NCIMB 9086 / R18194 / 383) TaxID=482957 RepID=UPI0015834C92|nr:hypothetical protein [Burkholderia lata]
MPKRIKNKFQQKVFDEKLPGGAIARAARMKMAELDRHQHAAPQMQITIPDEES